MRKGQVLSLDFLLSLLIITYTISYVTVLSGEVKYSIGLSTKNFEMESYADTLSHNLINQDLAVLAGEINASKLLFVDYNLRPYSYCITFKNSTDTIRAGECSFDYSKNIANVTRYVLTNNLRSVLEVVVYE